MKLLRYLISISAGASGEDSEVERDGGHGYKDRAIARKRTPLKYTDLAVNPSSPEKVGDKKKIKNDRNNDKNDDKSETVVPLTLPPWTTGQIPR